jgi:hypothetical protein
MVDKHFCFHRPSCVGRGDWTVDKRARAAVGTSRVDTLRMCRQLKLLPGSCPAGRRAASWAVVARPTGKRCGQRCKCNQGTCVRAAYCAGERESACTVHGYATRRDAALHMRGHWARPAPAGMCRRFRGSVALCLRSRRRRHPTRINI